jgi:glutathione-regulated potassium-efflux system ancillary protein KefC/glutathione-regulated potassium-efflux system protein KefB
VEPETLFQAFVYLAAAVVAAPVAKRIGLGSVLGYLIAGAIVGPYALDLVGDASRVGHVAEFGVVIMLFLIGLEVRPASLWRMKVDIFGLGGLQVVVTAAALGGAAFALGLGWREATAVGLILSLSSTAIVLQTLEERGLRQGPVGQSAFGVLLFQDLAVIPLFAVLPLLAVAGAGAPGEAEAHAEGLLAGAPPWAQALAVLAAIAAVVIGGRYATRPVFRYIAAARLREIFTAAALLLVVGVAVLMQAVGLSPALGAFLAGVVLAESEFRRELETDIEPFRGLLLGLFFITVGAGLDFGLLASQPLLIAGLVLGLMLAKAAVLFALSLAFRTPWRDAAMTAVALSQGGEFAFVLFAFSIGVGALTGSVAALLTAVVAVSMALTPLAVAGYERLARPRRSERAAPANEAFDERPPVAIVAGFGRFGQIVGRTLEANGFATSTLDSSIEQIGLLRKFGRRVYYGDATRIDLLRSAGAEGAKLLIVAIDDRDQALKLVEEAHEAFPHLCILARAYDRRHAYELLRKGAHHVERETFEAALNVAIEALRAVGYRAHQAERAAKLFRRHDRRQFDALAPISGDEDNYVLAAREASNLMDKLLNADLRRTGVVVPDEGWDTSTLNAELRARPGEALEAEERPRP